MEREYIKQLQEKEEILRQYREEASNRKKEEEERRMITEMAEHERAVQRQKEEEAIERRRQLEREEEINRHVSEELRRRQELDAKEELRQQQEKEEEDILYRQKIDRIHEQFQRQSKEKEIELQKCIGEEEKRCRREEIEKEEYRKRQEIAQLEKLKQANEAQRQLVEGAGRQEELRRETDRENELRKAQTLRYVTERDRGKQKEYGAIPKRPSQQSFRVQSQIECREQDEREYEGVNESFRKVPDREIADMDRQMKLLGLRGRTSTMIKLFEEETATSLRRGSRQDTSANQVNDFGEDNRQLHTLQDANVFEKEFELEVKPRLASSLHKEMPESERNRPRLSSEYCQRMDSTVKQELNAFGGIDPKTAFFQGYKLALEEMKKEGITTLSKRNDKDLSEQQSQERVSVATERFIGQNKEDINSDYLKQINYLFILFIQCFKRVTHLAVIAILPCGPLFKHIYIYTSNVFTSWKTKRTS